MARNNPDAGRVLFGKIKDVYTIAAVMPVQSGARAHTTDPWLSERLFWEELLAKNLTKEQQLKELSKFYGGELSSELISQLEGLYGSLDKSEFAYNWKGEHVTPEFKDKVVEICKNLDIKPDDLMAVMATESGINPNKWNGNVAVGLIQFTNSSVNYINEKFKENITLDSLSKLSSTNQLEYVEKYLSVNKGKMNDVLDVYATTFAPYSSAVGDPDVYSTIYEGGSGAYKSNTSLDNDKDGKLTKHDLQLQIDKLVGNYRY